MATNKRLRNAWVSTLSNLYEGLEEKCFNSLLISYTGVGNIVRGHIKSLTSKHYYILEQVRTYTLSIFLLIISVTDTDYCFEIKNGYVLALN